MNEVDLGEFMKFCKDFSIPLNKAKLTEIFKKTSISHKPHKFEQFYNAIGRIGMELNKVKGEEVNNRLSEINKLLRKRAEEERNN